MPKKVKWKIKGNPQPRAYNHVTVEEDVLAATWESRGMCEVMPDDTPIGPYSAPKKKSPPPPPPPPPKEEVKKKKLKEEKEEEEVKSTAYTTRSMSRPPETKVIPSAPTKKGRK